MRAVTPGQVQTYSYSYTLLHTCYLMQTQYAVFYDEQQCLGGACIDAIGPSLWQLNQSGQVYIDNNDRECDKI